MYKAIMEIGEYKSGDIVPDEKAELWNRMYAVKPCIEDKTIVSESVIEKKIIDVSNLDDKLKERVEDIIEDLKDDGKRNYSHKKKRK
jgi:hypothetical protein